MSESDFDWKPRRVLIGYDGSQGAKDAVEQCRVIAAEDTSASGALIRKAPWPVIVVPRPAEHAAEEPGAPDGVIRA